VAPRRRAKEGIRRQASTALGGGSSRRRPNAGVPIRDKERFLRQRAHVVLTSGRRHESVSDGPPGDHSPFAAALLDALRDDDAAALTSSSLYARIGEAFTRQGVGHVPQLAHASDAMGEFVFFLRE
jgi:hypothetical protein